MCFFTGRKSPTGMVTDPLTPFHLWDLPLPAEPRLVVLGLFVQHPAGHGRVFLGQTRALPGQPCPPAPATARLCQGLAALHLVCLGFRGASPCQAG